MTPLLMVARRAGVARYRTAGLSDMTWIIGVLENLRTPIRQRPGGPFADDNELTTQRAVDQDQNRTRGYAF